MRYNWAGNVIARDTVVAGKRVVVGYKDKFISTDIREWIKAPPNEKLEDALVKIPDLPKVKELDSFDRRAMLIWKYVAERITYVYDKEAHNLPDFWFFPEETLTIEKGDCEDSTYLLSSLLLASGISPFCVRAVLGIVHDENGNILGGHAWPVYLDEWGKWRLLESTLDTIPDKMPLADSLTEKGLKFQYEPMLCFNQYHLWEVRPSTVGIDRCLESMEEKVDAERARLDIKI